MSETKALGIIGQMYEDRKTGKKGKLDSRDEVRKTMILVGEDSKDFIISNSTFRSNWRKATTENAVVESSEPVVEEKVVEVKKVEHTKKKSKCEYVKISTSDIMKYFDKMIDGCSSLKDSHRILNYFKWRRDMMPNCKEMKVKFTDGTAIII